MAVELKRVSFDDSKLQTFQQYVADAVEELDKQRTTAGVLRISSSRKLVGNEDFVLVDSSGITAELFLVLPSPKVLQRALTVKVTRSSPSFGVTVKAVDIPAATSPTIDDGNTMSIGKNTTGKLTIVSDGRNFSTV